MATDSPNTVGPGDGAPQLDGAGKTPASAYRVSYSVWAFLLLLAMLLGLGIYAMKRLDRIRSGVRPSIVRPDPLTYRKPAEATDPSGRLLEGPRGWKQMGRPVQSEPLKGLPADLPLMDGALELNKYQRSVYGVVAGQREATPRWKEQYGVWQFEDQPMETVAEFYRKAAEAAGFEPFDDPHQKPDLLIRNYTRGRSNLMVRTRQQGGKVFLVLQYRYNI